MAVGQEPGFDMFSLRCPVDIQEELWGQGFRRDIWTEDEDSGVVSTKTDFIFGESVVRGTRLESKPLSI